MSIPEMADPGASERPGDEPSPAGRLVSVNVGLPRDVPWHGRTVHTAVWKHPVAGSHTVRTLNIDGDEQGDLAGHGGPHRAVLVYQLDSYRYWTGHLGRDDLSPGSFGENFTVDGLPDDEVCIGDRYRIGGAIFEVSQPRVTCYRVGMRLAEPELPSLLISHRRPGFYVRVVQEGVVRAGDAIVKVRSGEQSMTVAEIDGLLYLPGHDRSDLARALRIGALSPGWQQSFTAMLSNDGRAGGNVGLVDAATTAPVAWPGFRPLRVVSAQRESDTVLSLLMASPDGRLLPGARPGQFVAVRLSVPGSPPIVRSYSLSGPPDAGTYRISVKRETRGVASTFVTTHPLVDQTVEVAAPRGGFTLQDGADPVLLISAGIGVTPVLAMLHALVASASTREVWWIHGARSSAEHPFAAEVAGLLARLPHAHSEICYSAPLPGDDLGRDFTRRGRVDADLLRRLPIPRDAHAYVCGPVPFMDDMRITLTDLLGDLGRVASETFGARAAITPGIATAPAVPPHPPAGPPGAGPAVTFARTGLRVPWRRDMASLLELAEACDVPTRWSCRTGVCHTCETGLLSGTVAYRPVPVDAAADGNALLCCATPTADLVLDL
jgi:ferredoxin-NADP reductase/MOSC domain-containing protein YiiM